MTSIIEFWCPGLPKTAGSKRAFIPKGWTRPIIVDDCKKGADWKADLKAFAIAAYAGAPLEGPLCLDVRFTLPRPKSHSTSKGLRATAPAWHQSKPDLLKLTRCLEDALTGILWRDDSQIAAHLLTKAYGDKPGAYVTVRPAEMPDKALAALRYLEVRDAQKDDEGLIFVGKIPGG